MKFQEENEVKGKIVLTPIQTVSLQTNKENALLKRN